MSYTKIIVHIFLTICISSLAQTSLYLNHELQNQALARHGSQDADQEYQELAEEAFNDVGIPGEERTTIKQLSPLSIDYTYAAACTCAGQIFVNQPYLQQCSTASRRMTMFHEVFHKLQTDANGKINCINPTYQHPEKEADLKGALAGNCYKCTRALAAARPSKKSTTTKALRELANGYATREELLVIAAQQKASGALCKYHKK